ncbi:MAG: hypothetical protein PVJ84_01655 [Desulfobacteraceae bacterium]|jgi:hypothetical protein
MKDERGLYYYPFPGNKRVRMYVRQPADEPEFRMWNQDDSQMWDQHGWVPYSAIVQAKSLYKGGPFDPDRAYDPEAAKALIAENG